MSFFRAARSAARSSFRPRRTVAYSTAHAAAKPSSDVYWIVTSVAVCASRIPLRSVKALISFLSPSRTHNLFAAFSPKGSELGTH